MTLLSLSVLSIAQERSVSGSVKDASGEPLPGAVVKVKGLSLGAVADFEGKFLMTVPTEATDLVVSLIGYKTQEVSIGNQSIFNFTLEEDAKQLEEVVVTGYSTIDRKKLTGSVSTVSAASIEQVPIASFDQVLQGQTPGLYVNAGSGQPGASATILIRGVGSLGGGNDPLIILDGVPIEADQFATLNANDFESVNTLKDAQATAQYGSRGSNGVIVITTKKGTTGKPKVTYRYLMGASQASEWGVELMDTDEALSYEEMIQNGPGWTLSPNNPGRPTEEEIWDPNNSAYGGIRQLAGNIASNPRTADEILTALKGVNTNWRDIVTQTAPMESHELNISGGNEQTRYYVSGNYFSQEGIAIGSGLERGTLRFNVDNEVSQYFRTGISTNLGYSKSNFIASEGLSTWNPFVLAAMNKPYVPVRSEVTGDYAYGAFTGRNPIEIIDNYTENKEEKKVVGSFYAEAEPLDGLKAKTRVGLDYRESVYKYITSPLAPALSAEGGSYDYRNRTNLLYNFVNTLDYSRTFNEVHDVSVTVGTEFIKQAYQGFNWVGYGLNAKLPDTPAAIPDANSANPPEVSGFQRYNSLMSYFGFLNYSYNGKYNFSSTFRRDGSSKFGANNRWANFWSVGGSWNVSDEDFLSNSSVVSLLRLKMSYGTVGNQDASNLAIGPYESFGLFGANSSYIGQGGIEPSTIANPDLKWEVSNKFNLGIDFGLFNDRISGTVEVYNDVTTDLFIPVQLSATSGFTSLQMNAGSMRNRGIELQLNTDNLEIEDFRWSTSLNFSYNKNEILDLGQVDQYESGTYLIKEGLPFGSHFVVGWAGVNPANGQPLYTDADGNVTTEFSNANARADFGTYLPPITGGITNTFSYKGLELSVFFSYQLGHTLFNNQSFFLENPGTAYNQSVGMLNMWQQPGDVTDIPLAGYNRQFTSRDLEKGDFLRLRNVMLSYNLPKTLLDKVKIAGAKVHVQAQNLYTWTQFTGFDPEIGNNIAQFQYPMPRTFTAGIDLSF
ncbi:TonB-linked SusC/RagA family outer membrane protein [Sediminitomix flava]|uniref:TonB-linked SusC/RagA family outer membrane protein n=2 Tax=Sediminitomix flava TaxID=379075 RepID=A0A315ZHN3_SEDFL|nr:TonB-linked SusC/RagA family outer membrane protein [Sediminitomix flava]